jgi:hypothetical protein
MNNHLYKLEKTNPHQKIVKIHQKNIMIYMTKLMSYVDDPIGFELDMFLPSNKDENHKHPN